MSTLQKDLIESFTQAILKFSTEIEGFSYLDQKIGADIFIINQVGYKTKCNMKEIITNLNYPPSTATRKVNRLVELGYLRRVRPNNNRRSVELKLTNKGREIFALFHKQRFDPLTQVIKRFSKEEINVFLNVLHKIIS